MNILIAVSFDMSVIIKILGIWSQMWNCRVKGMHLLQCDRKLIGEF